MGIDINEVITNMLEAVKVSIKDDWNLVKETTNTYLTNCKGRLELLASMKLNGEIDTFFFQKRLEDEKELLESELHSIAVVNKVMAQNAANFAIKVLEKSVMSIL